MNIKCIIMIIIITQIIIIQTIISKCILIKMMIMKILLIILLIIITNNRKYHTFWGPTLMVPPTSSLLDSVVLEFSVCCGGASLGLFLSFLASTPSRRTH